MAVLDCYGGGGDRIQRQLKNKGLDMNLNTFRAQSRAFQPKQYECMAQAGFVKVPVR